MAKAAIITLCQRYAANTASRCFHLRHLVSCALELALAASDWPAVEAGQARLRSLEAAVVAGLAILFSIRQGDPLAALLFVIQLGPFLVPLEAVLAGLRMANIREASFGYMDDVLLEVLWDDLQDIVRVDLA